MSDYAIASGLFVGFAIVASGLAFFFLRAAHGRRSAWIAAVAVLVFLAALGCALAIWVLPDLRRL